MVVNALKCRSCLWTQTMHKFHTAVWIFHWCIWNWPERLTVLCQNLKILPSHLCQTSGISVRSGEYDVVLHIITKLSLSSLIPHPSMSTRVLGFAVILQNFRKYFGLCTALQYNSTGKIKNLNSGTAHTNLNNNPNL